MNRQIHKLQQISQQLLRSNYQEEVDLHPVCFQSLHTSGAKSITVTVRTLVGALIGPNCFVGASGFFWMKDV